MILGLKPLPKPPYQTKLMQQQEAKRDAMQDAILEAIAQTTALSLSAIREVYNHYKSYDLTIAMCNYAYITGQELQVRLHSLASISACPHCGKSLGVSK